MKKLFNKAAVSAVLALAMVLSVVSAAFAAPQFSDINGHWAEETIVKWANNGFAKGYPDGTFKPDGNVTRAEFVAFVDRFFGFTDKGSVVEPFADTPANEWYGYNKEAVVPIAFNRNLIKDFGDAQNKFYPNKPITRQEAFIIIARALGLNNGSVTVYAGNLGVYVDVQALNAKAKVLVGPLVGLGIIQGDYNGLGELQLRPNDPLTRAEAVTILDNICNLFPWIFGNLGALVYVNVDVLNAVNALVVVGGLDPSVAIAKVNGALNNCNCSNPAFINAALIPLVYVYAGVGK